jgi:hypothetical protein
MKRAKSVLWSGVMVVLVLLALLGIFGCVPPDDNCEPAAYYGPPPCTDDQECVTQDGTGWYCDQENTFLDGCGQQVTWPVCKFSDCQPAVYYGPPQCTDDPGCIADHGAGWYCDLTNTFDDGCGTDIEYPVCRQADCDPAVYYGPPPCTDDQECIDEYGAGWYCNEANTFTDNCGNAYTYAVCAESCEPAAWYGPLPCETDQQCIDQNGADWFCDVTNTFDDGCGNQVAWPVCRQTDCEPATYYGPPPCTSNDDCTIYGTDWYCDTTNTFTDNCGNSYTWAMCKQTP